MLDWQAIDTVLLDMDGTLLDLHFDNYLWLNTVPQAIAEKNNISVAQAKTMVEDDYERVFGTLNWYCLDHWQQHFGIDIIALHEASTQRIQLRPDCMPFLNQLQHMRKQRILITNAHPDSLALKLKHTELASGLDTIISSHQSGYPKEDPRFWDWLYSQYEITAKRCLFVDDNEHILVASQKAGIGFQLGITNPDSMGERKSFELYPATHDLTTVFS
ncbi:GMP/IMP nucleotidase [Shewanella sp. OPT22]|nr:GMP/IMP nucleotidase [Shewanella sp. OPT22]